jgi:hypothetical protein
MNLNSEKAALDELLYACDERIEISQKIIDACKRS